MKNLLLVTAFLLSLGSAQAMAGNNENGGSNGNGYGHCKENGKGHEKGNDKGRSKFLSCIEKELNLPPEPDEAENNATILGVDVNENNIRDDVERKIAFDLYDQPAEMKREMRYAQTWNEIFDADGDQAKIVQLLKERSLNNGCNTVDIQSREDVYNAINNSYDPDDTLTNSFERRKAYLQATKSIRGLRLPSDEDVREYCSQFE